MLPTVFGPSRDQPGRLRSDSQETPADMWSRLSSRAWRSGTREAIRAPLRLAGSGLMSWRACRLRDGAVMLICAGWLPQGRAVRQERFCWSRSVSYTHLRAHETDSYLVCRLLLEKKKKNN